jgi:23S rRNA (cytidine1920-2'-O)/16S rRNA (cytidine1409-2'-O)-methyltransferase
MWVQRDAYALDEANCCEPVGSYLLATSSAVSIMVRRRADWCDVGHTARYLPRRSCNGAAASTVPAIAMAADKVRLDTLLAQRGLFASRSRAAASVMAGSVRLGRDGERAAKPGLMVAPDVDVSVDEAPRFVSRGGVKLENALERTRVEVEGRRCLDVGASTGGFTDCLLQRGAAHVVALDVAYGELDWRLRGESRVTVLERTNARAVTADQLPYAPELIVADVSFISLAKVLPAVLACAAPRFDALAMIKPQFEVGRERVGKGGVVRDAAVRREALVGVAMAARALGCAVLGFASSGLAGPKGNLETFVWLAEAGRAGDRADVEGAAREVEP